jgi:hypothetical protein
MQSTASDELNRTAGVVADRRCAPGRVRVGLMLLRDGWESRL